MTTRDPFPMEKFDNDDKFGNKTTNQGFCFQSDSFFRCAENSIFFYSKTWPNFGLNNRFGVFRPVFFSSREISFPIDSVSY